MLFAQKLQIKISPEFKLPKNKTFQDHLWSDATGHYVCFQEVNATPFSMSVTVVLEKYSPSFKLEYSKEFEADRKGVASLGMRYYQGRIIWMLSETNKKEDYVRYSILPIGLDGKQGKMKDLAKFKYEGRDDLPAISWETSRDSSKLFFRATFDKGRDDEKFRMFLSVMDKNFDVLWSQKVVMPYSEERVEVIDALLKDDGSVYILAKIYENDNAKESKKDKKNKTVAAYDVVLLQYNKDSKEPKEYQLKLGDAFVRGAHLAVDKAGALKCAGFYANTRNGSTNGVFFLQLDENGTVNAANKKEFTVSDLKIFGKENTDKDKSGETGLESNFKFSEFLVRDDGSAVVVAEENYSYTVSSYNGRTWTYTTYYVSKDIVIFTIGPDGKVERTSIIPKYQKAAHSDYFQSYVSLVHKDEIRFFYNEDKDNMEKPVNNPKPKVVNRFDDCVAVMTTLHADGNLTRKPLFEAKDIESLFVPKNSNPFGKNQLFFTSFKRRMMAKNTFHIGTITLP
jgi:hypothetical protein